MAKGDRGTRKRKPSQVEGRREGGAGNPGPVYGQKDQALSLRTANSQRDKGEGGGKRQPNGKPTQKRGKGTGAREEGEGDEPPTAVTR